MAHHAVSTQHAPQAIGPYSQAVVAGNLVFTSGQIPLDPTSQKMVEGDVRAQAERVMENLHAVLTAAGVTFAQVVKATIYLTDLQDFARVNEVYARHFSGHVPARATVQVAALPRGVHVEIDAIAVVPA